MNKWSPKPKSSFNDEKILVSFPTCTHSSWTTGCGYNKEAICKLEGIVMIGFGRLASSFSICAVPGNLHKFDHVLRIVVNLLISKFCGNMYKTRGSSAGITENTGVPSLTYLPFGKCNDILKLIPLAVAALSYLVCFKSSGQKLPLFCEHNMSLGYPDFKLRPRGWWELPIRMSEPTNKSTEFRKNKLIEFQLHFACTNCFQSIFTESKRTECK